MIDVGMPEPASFDDPRFDAFLDQLTAHLNQHPPEPSGEERDLTDLASVPVGIMSAAVLSDLDTAHLSGRDRVTVLQARLRSQSHFQALIYEDMAAIHDACDDAVDAELAWDAAASEIRAALRLTRRAADHELDIALSLRDRVPMVLAALKAGDIDQRRAVTITKATAHLSVPAAREVAREILRHARHLTTGQLRERIRRLAIDLDPEAAAERYRLAVDGRRFVSEPTDDGTSDLMILDAPPDRAAAARRHIDRIARSLRSPTEPRSIDQLRADVALDLLTGRTPATGTSRARGGGSVHLSVDLTTLIGLDDHAGHLAGYGPIIADLARQITEDQRRSPWRYTVTDPDSGQPVATGTTRRRPTADQHRAVTAAHPTCVFPGCRMPAVDCDIDHRTAWSDDGPTSAENLAPLCRHDHRLKHEYGWQLERLDDGDHLWTSPLGHTHTTSGRSP